MILECLTEIKEKRAACPILLRSDRGPHRGSRPSSLRCCRAALCRPSSITCPSTRETQFRRSPSRLAARHPSTLVGIKAPDLCRPRANTRARAQSHARTHARMYLNAQTGARARAPFGPYCVCSPCPSSRTRARLCACAYHYYTAAKYNISKDNIA